MYAYSLQQLEILRNPRRTEMEMQQWNYFAQIYTDKNVTIILKSDLNLNHDQDNNWNKHANSSNINKKDVDELKWTLTKIYQERNSSVPSGAAEELNTIDIKYVRENNVNRVRHAVSVTTHLTEKIYMLVYLCWILKCIKVKKCYKSSVTWWC